MRKPIQQLVGGLALLAATFTPFNAIAAPKTQSGIAGQAYVYSCAGPIHPGENCLQPYPTTVTVWWPDGSHTQLVTDQEGRFELILAPGDYLVIPDGVCQSQPPVAPLEVHIENNRVTPVTIVYNFGLF